VPDAEVAADLCSALGELGTSVPDHVAAATDPFDVLRFAASVSPSTADHVDARFRSREVDAVKTAPQTPGLTELLRHIAQDGKTVSIVSNNATEAVRSYLERTGLTPLIGDINAREDSSFENLKPAPFLLERAMSRLGARPTDCVMIGDSVTDIQAAKAAGTKVIAYANKPGKRERFAAHQPDALIDSMTVLFEAPTTG
jgi:HAD superfamily hydrolase (TIGR01662 family)